MNNILKAKWYQWLFSTLFVVISLIALPVKHTPPAWFWPFQILVSLFYAFPPIYGILLFVSLFKWCLARKWSLILTSLLGIFSIIPTLIIAFGLPAFYFGYCLICIEDFYQQNNYIVSALLFALAIFIVQFFQLTAIALWKYSNNKSQAKTNTGKRKANVTLSIVATIIAVYAAISLMYPRYQFILPNAYRGWFVIVMNTPDADRPAFNGMNFIYHVPESGLLPASMKGLAYSCSAAYADGTSIDGSKGIYFKDFGTRTATVSTNTDCSSLIWGFIGSKQDLQKIASNEKTYKHIVPIEWVGTNNSSGQDLTGIWLELAEKSAAFGDYAKAEKIYAETLKLTEQIHGPYSSNSLHVLYDLETVLASQGKIKEADLVKQDLLKRIPFAAADGPYRPKSPAKNLDSFYKNAIADRRQEEAAAFSKRIEQLSDNSGSDAEVYFHQAFNDFQAGKYNNSIAALNKAIALDPKNANSYANRAAAYGKLKNYQQAISDCNKAIELSPNDALAYCNRGASYFHSNQLPQAEKDLSKSIELDPKYGEAYYTISFVYEKLGKHELAKKSRQTAKTLGYKP